jgi:plasmid stability protein
MPAILIPDVQENTLNHLRVRAAAHGRTPEAEAKAILEQSLQAPSASVWDQVNLFKERLAASNRSFSDSADLLREDRER